MNVSVTEPGYIYAWVSNTSENTKVWFDDFSVAHTSNFVTQATDYGAWGDEIRTQKTDESIYRYGYQGQYAEMDEETGWNHFELREYDPVIGRWTAVDPKRQYHSPYLSMGNNPIAWTDPDGGEVLTDFVNTKTQQRVHIEDGKKDVITVEPENWAAFMQTYNLYKGYYNPNIITSRLLQFGSMKYDVGEIIKIRQLHETAEGYEYGLKLFVEGPYAYPNPDRSADNTNTPPSKFSVTILGVRDSRARANIHFHYTMLGEEAPSQGLPGEGYDSDHVGRGAYNIVVSKNRVWFYNRYKETVNKFTGMPQKERWGSDFSVPYQNK